MAFQVADAVANSMLDGYEAAFGASPILRIRSGAAPANLAAASSGTVLATLNLPADWMANAAARSKTKSGTWQDPAADATGVAGHYEIVKSDGVTRMEQGTVGITGSGADLELQNPNLAIGQDVQITGFTKNFPGNA